MHRPCSSDRENTRILLLGKNGQVGWELQRALPALGEVIATGRNDLDMTDPARLREAVKGLKPHVIVNAAAYNAVDKAESEPELAMAINGTAPSILGEEAKKCGALLVHYSTDYVFDGRKAGPYSEEDSPDPINTYGRSKLMGEEAIRNLDGTYLIFRTSWVYGERGHNFYLTIRRLAREKEEISVVDDQIGAPTWCRSIAENTAMILAQGINRKEGFQDYFKARKGLYHVTAGGQTNWCEFARCIVDDMANEEKKLQRIRPIKTRDYHYEARRPLNSVLSNAKLNACFGVRQNTWNHNFQLYRSLL